MIDKEIPKLIRDLQNSKVSVRVHSARSLGEIGDTDALPGLVMARKDPEPVVRREVLKALGRIGGKRVSKYLFKALRHDPDIGVRASCVVALCNMKSESLAKKLVKEIQDQDEKVAVIIIYWLGKIGATGVIPDLAEVFQNNQNENILRFTAISLGNLGSESIPYLLRFIHHEDFSKRAAASEGLGRINDTRATEALVNALADKDKQVRMAAAEALRDNVDSATLPDLVKVFQNEDDATVAGLLLQVLESIGKQAIPIIIEALTNKHMNVRAGATRIFGKIGDDSYTNHIIAMLYDEYDFVQQRGVEALENIGTPEALKAIAQWRNKGQSL